MATKQKLTIEDEIDHNLRVMSTLIVSSDEYKVAADNIKILREAQSYQKAAKIPWEPIIVAATAIGQTVMILYHEQLHVISSKAINFILKGRI